MQECYEFHFQSLISPHQMAKYISPNMSKNLHSLYLERVSSLQQKGFNARASERSVVWFVTRHQPPQKQ